MRIAIAAFSTQGNNLLRKIVEYRRDDSFTIFSGDSIREWTKTNFNQHDAMIYIGALGIAVRLVGRLAVSKASDPAVIVIDDLGQYSIPVLSGHLGGANRIASELAVVIGGVAVITTATDINHVFAVDLWSVRNSCTIDNTDTIKYISSALLTGDGIGLHTDFDIYGKLPKNVTLQDSGKLGVAVSINPQVKPFEKTLNLIPHVTTIGVGCRKNTSAKAFEQFILDILGENNISIKSVIKIASIDLKKDEGAIVAFAEKYNLLFDVYSAEELGSVDGEFTGSDFVKKATGVDNVCERSAMKDGGSLIVKKQSKNGMTCAISIADYECVF